MEAAITCYQAALRVQTERDFPVDWAMTQNNLGNAYRELGEVYRDLLASDREAHLKAAIACYKAALRVRTERAFPVKWAMTQNNLGRAYYNLPTGDREAHLKAAIACFRAALRVRTERDFPVDWADIQNNLGRVYRDLPTGDQRANLEAAITCYQAALRVCTERDFPVEWAATQNNLGIAYADLPTGDQGANLEAAIACFRAALRVRTEWDFPIGWARMQNNLGAAYCYLPIGNREANLEAAISCFRAALRVWTAETLPFDCLETLCNLSLLHYREQQWQAALATCHEGMLVLESVRMTALTAVERTRLLSKHAALFEWAVVCGVKSGRFADALVYAERSKTRNLVEALTRRDVQPRRVSDAEWRAYQDRLAEAQELERQLASDSGHDPAAVAQTQPLRDSLMRVRTDLDRFEAQFRTADPGYLPTAPPLTFADIQGGVRQAQGVLVEFRVTEAGTFVFLLSGDNTDIAEEQVVHVPEFTTRVLNAMLVKSEDGKAVDGWLVTYSQWRSQPRDVSSHQAWMDCLEQTTGALQDQLLRHVRERLQRLYPRAKRLILVLNKGLNLLPLHAAYAGTNGQRRYWLDDYELLYAPSCAVLRHCLEREAERGERAALFAVQNPSGNLLFGDWDVEEAAQHFRTTHILAGAEATLAQVKRFIAQGHEVLLSCHGTYNLNDVFASHLILHGDDRLLLSDILQLDLSNTWLVVLSACETAVSDVRDRVDEVQGLHTAFLLAGAPTVVGSLWSVNDLATALLLQRFHANLYTHGWDKAKVLREAQLWLREMGEAEALAFIEKREHEIQVIFTAYQQRMSHIGAVKARFSLLDLKREIARSAAAHGGKPFAHPYWWAAFQCVGAGWQPAPDASATQ